MRVLHFNQHGSMKGGVEGYIADVVRSLEAAGHQSRLIHFGSSARGDLIPKTDWAYVATWPASPTPALRVVESVIAKWEPDVAYVHAVYHPKLIRWVSERLPTVAYIHGPYPVCPGSAQYLRRRERPCPHKSGLICLLNAQIEQCCWGHNPLKHVRSLAAVHEFVTAYQEVPVILVGSRYMTDLLKMNGIPRQQTHILAPFLVAASVAEPSSSSASRNILFAGRLAQEKGLHWLMQALSSVDTEWSLTVAGDGDLGHYRVLACHLGVANRVEFLGWVDRGGMSRRLRSCAFVAVPSLWPEPFGRVGPEALLHGRPVIASRVGGIPDWLEHGETGYLVEPGDVPGLACSLGALLESPRIRTRMGHEGRHKAVEMWDTHLHVDRLLKYFQIAIESHR